MKSLNETLGGGGGGGGGGAGSVCVWFGGRGMKGGGGGEDNPVYGIEQMCVRHFSDIPVYAHIFRSDNFRGCLFSW